MLHAGEEDGGRKNPEAAQDRLEDLMCTSLMLFEARRTSIGCTDNPGYTSLADDGPSPVSSNIGKARRQGAPPKACPGYWTMADEGGNGI